MNKFMRPKYFLLGILFGFTCCCLAGYLISYKARFNHFTRFTSYISTSLNYFPLASELLVTAEHNVDPKKILVLVGGSSIMRGDGQNEDDLWSRRLQNNLGDQFQVLNYGYNGAGFSSFGGVAYRILKEHFPKIIFVSTCTYAEDSAIDGGNTYGYLFWDAYYKNLFHPNIKEQKIIANLRKQELKTREGIELHLMSYLDSQFYFRNLWNWFTYRFISTVYDKNTFPNPFKARRYFPDDIVDNASLAEAVHKDNERFNSEAKLLQKSYYHNEINMITHHYVKAKADEIRNTYKNLYQPSDRANMLCFFSEYNPKHLATLPKNDLNAYFDMIADAGNIIKSLGYNAVTVKQLKPSDYIDIMHYVASGGAKVADNLAPKIKRIAINEGYLKTDRLKSL